MRSEARDALDQMLTELVRAGGSDLHLTTNAPPCIRIHGSLGVLPGHEVLTPESISMLIRSIVTPEQWLRFETNLEYDFAYDLPGVSRFRVNLSQQRNAYASVMRAIPHDIKPLHELGIPDQIERFAYLKRGLVLVTGPTGSGKTTTLASLLDLANRSRRDHIVTIEDPIEFLHTNKRSIINQREVGLDTKSYERALRGVMRAAPEVILIGEIRDRESMMAAISLAGTGHLVLSTLHANNCAETLDRIINMFTHEQQKQVTLDLSQYLRAVVAQRLVLGPDNRRVAAVEVMLNTPHIAELVKRGDVIGIKEAIMLSSERGIQSFDVALLKLYKDSRITLEEALSNADSRSNLETKINFG
jgi:pilus retraction protein PilT